MPAGGSGRRFGGNENKLFALLGDAPIWLQSARRLRSHPRVARIIMPVARVDRERFAEQIECEDPDLRIELAEGGAERTDSVHSGVLQVVDDSAIKLIAVHDAARPLVRHDDLSRVFEKADQSGAAILATPVAATVKQTLDDGQSCQTVDRSTLWLAQTPQVFRRDLLRSAYERHRGRPATDDAELVSRIGVSVALVEGSTDNLKITNPGDLVVAEAIIQRQDKPHQT